MAIAETYAACRRITVERDMCDTRSDKELLMWMISIYQDINMFTRTAEASLGELLVAFSAYQMSIGVRVERLDHSKVDGIGLGAALEGLLARLVDLVAATHHSELDWFQGIVDDMHEDIMRLHDIFETSPDESLEIYRRSL